VRDSPAVFLPDGIDDDRGVSMQETLRAMKVFTSSLNVPFAISLSAPVRSTSSTESENQWIRCTPL
jgi:hypothetical protein